MTIRRQAIFVLVPVFAVVALLDNGVAYFLESRTARSGLEGGAGAFAVSLAAFIRPADVVAIKANPSAETPLATALERLDRWGQIEGLALWDADGHKLIYRRPATTDLAPSRHAFGDKAISAVYYTSPLMEGANEDFYVIAYAPVRDGAGTVIAVVGIQIDANRYRLDVAQLRFEFARNTAIILLLGLLVAVALAAFVKRELRRLTQAATGIEHGGYISPPDTLIQEIAELGNTFGVLDGLIGENRAKTQRALVENEQFRSELDLVATFCDAFPGPEPRELTGLIVSFTDSCALAGRVRVATAGPAGAAACLARIRGDMTLETVQLASAATREFEDRIARGEAPADVLAALALLFPLQSATVLAWTHGAQKLHRFDLSDGTVRATRCAAPDATGDCVVHDLTGTAAAAIEIYLRRFPLEPWKKKFAELAVLSEGATGTILLMTTPARGPAAVSAPPTPA